MWDLRGELNKPHQTPQDFCGANLFNFTFQSWYFSLGKKVGVVVAKYIEFILIRNHDIKVTSYRMNRILQNKYWAHVVGKCLMGPEYHIDKIWSALLVIFHAKENVEKWFDFLFLELTITMVAT